MTKRHGSKGTSGDRKVLRRINATHVPAADMLELAEQVGMLDPANRQFEGLAFLAARHFSDEPELAIAAVFRMQGLARAVISGKLPGWARAPQADGSVETHHSLFAAAGEAPLTLSGNDLVFNRSTLLKRAFELRKGFT